MLRCIVINIARCHVTNNLFRAQHQHHNTYALSAKMDVQEELEPALTKLDVVLTFSLEVTNLHILSIMFNN